MNTQFQDGIRGIIPHIAVFGCVQGEVEAQGGLCVQGTKAIIERHRCPLFAFGCKKDI